MASWDCSSAESRRSCRRPSRQLHLLTAALAFVSLAPYCSSESYTAGELAMINQACVLCDYQVLPLITDYQNNFMGIVERNTTKNFTALEIGNLHCKLFSTVVACYNDCVGNYSDIYTSTWKKTFKFFYTQFCDADCQLAFLPGCYLAAGASYGLYKTGCDVNKNTLLSGISTCMDLWMSKQNCQGVCTPGQRAASGLKLQLEGNCMIPDSAYDCQVVVTTCIEAAYGPYGSTFVAGGPVLNGLGNDSCRTYGKSYSQCLNNTVHGRVIFGNPPYTVEYDQPCMDYMNVVTHLIGLSDAAVEPLCDHPLLSLSAICSPATTTTRVVYTSAASLLTAKATTTVEEQSTTTTALPTSERPTTEAPTTTASATTSSTSSTEQPTTTVVSTAEPSTTEALTSSSVPGTTSSPPTENVTASHTKKPCKKRKR